MPEHDIDDMLLGLAVAEDVVALHAAGQNHPGHVATLGPYVVLHVHVVGHGGDAVGIDVAVVILLVVCLGDVVALDEGFLGDLPVARHHLGHMDRLVAFLQLEAVEVRRQQLQIIRQGCALWVEVHEYEPAPLIDPGLGQAEFVLRYVFEVPLARDVHQFAGERPCESVERAAECPDVSRLQTQRVAAVQTGVVVGADLVGAGSNDDEAVIDDVVDHVVADFGNLFEPTRYLPRLTPDPLHFAVMPVPGDIAFDGQIRASHRDAGFFAEGGGRSDQVVVEQLLQGNTRDVIFIIEVFGGDIRHGLARKPWCLACCLISHGHSPCIGS